MTLAGFLTLRKKTAKSVHTHTWFAKGANARGTGTLSLDDKDAGKLRENLVADVSNRDDITTGANSISEKVTRGAPFRLFADLDFAAEDILAWKTSNDYSPDEFPREPTSKWIHVHRFDYAYKGWLEQWRKDGTDRGALGKLPKGGFINKLESLGYAVSSVNDKHRDPGCCGSANRYVNGINVKGGERTLLLLCS